jgi:hypothetical protein
MLLTNEWVPEGSDDWESESDLLPFEPFEMPRDHWWQHVLDTSWATEHEIIEACGPEYYLDQQEVLNNEE